MSQSVMLLLIHCSASQRIDFVDAASVTTSFQLST